MGKRTVLMAIVPFTPEFHRQVHRVQQSRTRCRNNKRVYNTGMAGCCIYDNLPRLRKRRFNTTAANNPAEEKLRWKDLLSAKNGLSLEGLEIEKNQKQKDDNHKGTGPAGAFPQAAAGTPQDHRHTKSFSS
jgi:hypothetical protein